MTELSAKMLVAAIYPFLFSFLGFLQSRGFDIELMYWGAVGQGVSILIQYSDERRKALASRSAVDWILWVLNIVKAGFLAMFFGQLVVDQGWLSSVHLAAIFIGLLADMALPLYEIIGKWVKNKIDK